MGVRTSSDPLIPACHLQEDDRGLTVQCALEGNCVLLRRDTLLSEALGLLDDAEQSVALVVSLHMLPPSQSCNMLLAGAIVTYAPSSVVWHHGTAH